MRQTAPRGLTRDQFIAWYVGLFGEDPKKPEEALTYSEATEKWNDYKAGKKVSVETESDNPFLKVVDRLIHTNPNKGLVGELVANRNRSRGNSKDEPDAPSPAPSSSSEKKTAEPANEVASAGTLTPEQDAIIKAAPPNQQANLRAMFAKQAPTDWAAVYGDGFDLNQSIYVEDTPTIRRRGVGTDDPERGFGGIRGNVRIHDETIPGEPVEKPAGEVIAGLYKMSPDDLARQQQVLFENGWYPPGTNLEDIPLGRVDAATRSAFMAAMGESARFNAAQEDPERRKTLDEIIKGGDPDARRKEKEAAKSGITTRTMNPISVKEAARARGLALTGRVMSEDDQAAFAAYYRGLEDEANAAERGAAAGGGDVVAAPGVADAADAWMRERDPAGVHGFGMLSRYNEFMSMLSSAS